MAMKPKLTSSGAGGRWWPTCRLALPSMKPKSKLSGAGGARLASVFLLLLLSVLARQAMAQSSLDFGDAPAPYPTLVSSNGARHTATGPLLGTLRDTENDGFPHASALGDDSTGSDDEDG